MQTENLPELLTVRDVARVLNVNVTTVRRWEARGRITGIRTPGGQRRFPRAEVTRILGTDTKESNA